MTKIISLKEYNKKKKDKEQKELLKAFRALSDHLVDNTKDVDPDIIKFVDDNFLELLDD